MPQLKTNPSHTYILHPQHHTVWNCTVSTETQQRTDRNIGIDTIWNHWHVFYNALPSITLYNNTSCQSLGFVLPLVRCRHLADADFPPDQLFWNLCLLIVALSAFARWMFVASLKNKDNLHGRFFGSKVCPCVSLLTKNNSSVALFPHRTAPLAKKSAGCLLANDTLCVYLVHK